jgi:uncharacterized protein
MTAIEHDVTQDEEAPDRGLIRRTFAAEMSEGDGRTIDVRVVPYGERITHNDGRGGVPKGVPYTEEWAPGTFSHQLGAANRVLVNFEHQEGLGGVVGHGKALLERQDGLYGSFKMHETPDGDKALMLVREGVLHGISLEAEGRRSIRTAEGVIRRVKANLVNVALCRTPAYAGAVVLALREEAEPLLDEEFLPIQPDPEVIERCRALGIALPQRYEAHPAETDTPPEGGTSEDGTRPETETETTS